MTGSALYLVIGLALATVAIVALVSWSLVVLRRPRTLVARGDWPAARAAAALLGKSWLRIFSGVREESGYAQAACLHLEGDFEGSLAMIARLREESPRGKFATAVALLEGANLVMSGGDARVAVDRLSAACAPKNAEPLPEDLMFLALARHSAGETKSAEKTFERAGDARPKDAPAASVYEPAFRYLRGLYLVRTSRAPEAAADLAAAAVGSVGTIYVERARALVTSQSAEGAPSGEELDPRSSLTGQVIDE